MGFFISILPEKSGNGVKGQYAGRISVRAALDGVTRITLNKQESTQLLSLPPGEGGSGQSPDN